MIWIIGAVVFGIILGICGYYFSNTAFTIFVAVVLVVISLLVMSDFEAYREYVEMRNAEPFNRNKHFAIYLIKKFENLSNHQLMVALSFTFSFFGARIITWLLAGLGFVPKFAFGEADQVEGTMKAYDYLERDDMYYWYD